MTEEVLVQIRLLVTILQRLIRFLSFLVFLLDPFINLFVSCLLCIPLGHFLSFTQLIQALYLGPMETDNDLSIGDYIDLLYWLRWSLAAYTDKVYTDYELRSALGLNDDDDVLYHSDENRLLLQPHYVVADKENQRIVLGIRGTLSFWDVITDIIAAPKSLPNRKWAHSGMYKSAKNLLDQNTLLFSQSESQKLDLKSYLEMKLKTSYYGYKLVITGHSLGAGVAALMAFLLKSEGGYLADKVTCWAFACPPVLDLDSATEARDYINSVVNRDDVVPRLSLRSVVDFLLNFHWNSLVENLATSKFETKSVTKSVTKLAKKSVTKLAKTLATSILAENKFTEVYEALAKFKKIAKDCLESLKKCEDEVIASGIEEYFPSNGCIKRLKRTRSGTSFKNINLLDYLKKKSLYVPGMLHHIVNVEGDDPKLGLEHPILSYWMTVLAMTEDPRKAYDKGPFRIVRGTFQNKLIDIEMSDHMFTDHECRVHGNAISQALKHHLKKLYNKL